MKLRDRNWWKIGFFIVLFLFEGARELAVIENDAPPNFAIVSPTAYRSQDGSFVTAEGRWERTDGGEPLVPTAVSIQCERRIGSCIMVSTKAYDGYIFAPDIDRRPATFTDTGAEYLDDWPECNNLFVRIDAVHDLTTAVRTPKASDNTTCDRAEKQIQMRLGGYPKGQQGEWRKGHFVPLLDLLAAIVGVFD